MRVFIERCLLDLPPGGATGSWVATSGSDNEFDQYVQAVKDQNFNPPIPHDVADPLCYTIKLRTINNAEVICYKIGTYYGDESCLAAANAYVEFKYNFFPTLGPRHTTVVTCDDSTHPTIVEPETPGEFIVEGYWLASDPDTFVSVP